MGAHELSASAAGHLPALWRGDAGPRVALGAGERRDGLDITLARGGVEVRGRLAGARGGLVFAGHVLPSGSHARATTDAAGRFALTGLLASRYRPTAAARGLTGQATRSVVLGLGQSIDDLVIEVRRIPIVTAHVTGRTCMSLSATLVDRAAAPGSFERGYTAEATPEVGGRVQLDAHVGPVGCFRRVRLVPRHGCGTAAFEVSMMTVLSI